MKKVFLVVMSTMIITASYAQKQPKPKIAKANAARERGELAEAKEIIDQAIDYEKTKDDGKTWYYRGLIYATIDTTSNPQYNSLKGGALETAMAAFAKADELGDPDKEYFVINSLGFPETKSQQLEGYYGFYFNSAVENFQAENYEAAIEKFTKAAIVTPGDTNSLKNAAYAAHSGELMEEAVDAYINAIDAGAVSEDLFTNAVYLLSAELKDNEKALEVVQKGLAVYPGHSAMNKTKINLLIQMDMVEDAIEDLKAAIAAEPENTTLMFTLAAMYEELGDKEKALAAYDQAIAVDPNHFESNFNKGVMLLTAANDIYKQYSDLGISTADKKKAKELEPKFKAAFQEALPQWEKVYEIKPDDRQVVETLAYIYGRLKKYDEMEKLQDKLDSMPE